ncbi:MAG: radical SAM family heme chaperone HemW [Tissierellia bacterium]|nr:radical SAM family heme chaperone HemW [Tissierellia bacterium]
MTKKSNKDKVGNFPTLNHKNDNNEAYGLYIHIPFCPYKCHYCDFLTFSHADKKIDTYMSYLFREVKMYENQGIRLDSIFIGGGTPSYIDSRYIVELMKLIRKIFIVDSDSEISIEMNPNTLTVEKIRDYVNAGINRFSLGVQTFDDKTLKILGRSHTKDIVMEDIKLLRENGAKNISIDMMLANPGQDMKILEKDLENILQVDINHISYYTLILEDRTLFKHWLDKGTIKLFDDDLERDMFHRVVKKLEENGFNRYEISNFAKTGMESKHNKKYWKQTPYLAIGLGASASYEDVRTKNFSKFAEYFEAIDNGKLPIEIIENLSMEDREKEFIIMNMRLKNGFYIDDINKRFGIDFLVKYQDIVEKHKSYGTVAITDGRFRFTDYGLDVTNSFYIDII